MRFKKLISLSIITLIISQTVFGQMGRAKFEPYSMVGAGIGTASYLGEMSPYRQHIFSVFKMMRWSANANYTHYFSPRFGARASLSWIRLAGDDELFNRGGSPLSSNYLRNLHFRNDLKEFSVVGILNLRPENRNSARRLAFMPYLFGGVAAIMHNPKAKLPVEFDSKTWVALQPLGTEGQGQPGYAKPYSLVSYAVPVGVGFRWKWKDRWNFGVEGSFRFTGTDYIDDVGGNYADPGVLRSAQAKALANRSLEPIASRTGQDRTATVRKILFPNDQSVNPFTQALTDHDVGDPRGNPSKNDTYLTGTFQITYILPSKIRCPTIK